MASLRPACQRGGIQLAEIYNLIVIRVVAHHKGLGKIPGHIQHHPLPLGGGTNGGLFPGSLIKTRRAALGVCENPPDCQKSPPQEFRARRREIK